MAKRLSAAFQSCTDMVHFLRDGAQREVEQFEDASSLGNEPRAFVTLRSDIFSDSIALVV